MDEAKILRLCNEIDDEVTDIAFNSTHKHIYDCCESIREYLKAISAEITASAKSNADRIRQMTDEELAEFFCQISQCCLNDAGCSMCPIYDGCAQNVMCVERWLKQEVEKR